MLISKTNQHHGEGIDTYCVCFSFFFFLLKKDTILCVVCDKEVRMYNFILAQVNRGFERQVSHQSRDSIFRNTQHRSYLICD